MRVATHEGLRDIKVTELTHDDMQEAQLKMLVAIRQETIRQSRQLYNHSNPVDEYFSMPDAPTAGDFEIQPDFEIWENYNSILASLPVGMTSAVLQFGRERKIILYSGAATTVQTIININGVGIVANRSDRRVLTLTGTMTTGFHIELMGHALEREGKR